jgi:hypothetical protein
MYKDHPIKGAVTAANVFHFRKAGANIKHNIYDRYLGNAVKKWASKYT